MVFRITSELLDPVLCLVLCVLVEPSNSVKPKHQAPTSSQTRGGMLLTHRTGDILLLHSVQAGKQLALQDGPLSCICSVLNMEIDFTYMH